MTNKRKVEVYSAGCPVCTEVVKLVENISCSSCEVTVLDMNDISIAKQAKALGIHKVPAVVIDGKLADCCSNQGCDKKVLRAAGLGQPK